MTTTIIPEPRKIEINQGYYKINNNLKFEYADKNLEKMGKILQNYLIKITNRVFNIEGTTSDENTQVIFKIDENLKDEEYSIKINDSIEISGKNYQSLVKSIPTLLQLIQTKEDGIFLPKITINDFPFAPYRGLMVDLARKKHKLATLKAIVDLCFLYKLNYLHLHLSDNQSFTFPSEHFPELKTKGNFFTKSELEDLNNYAFERGIIIIPEIDLPGHSHSIIKARPDIFKINAKEASDSLINMGNEAVYGAINNIITDLIAIFKYSPYIHIGADEVNLQGAENDQLIQKYMKSNLIDSIEELYRHFIVRINEIVKNHEKKMCVWEGFRKEGKIEIPKDILVYEFESMYHHPQDLASAGYTIINTSWQPIYVVPRRRWSPEEIFKWNIYRWENFNEHSLAFNNPIQLKSSENILGAQICSWEQKDKAEIESLRKRIPAFSERCWSVNESDATLVPSQDKVENFLLKLEINDKLYEKMIQSKITKKFRFFSKKI